MQYNITSKLIMTKVNKWNSFNNHHDYCLPNILITGITINYEHIPTFDYMYTITDHFIVRLSKQSQS